MNQDLLGKRILIRTLDELCPREVVIVEYSPTGNYCRMIRRDKRFSWIAVKSFELLEELPIELSEPYKRSPS